MKRTRLAGVLLTMTLLLGTATPADAAMPYHWVRQQMTECIYYQGWIQWLPHWATQDQRWPTQCRQRYGPWGLYRHYTYWTWIKVWQWW